MSQPPMPPEHWSLVSDDFVPTPKSILGAKKNTELVFQDPRPKVHPLAALIVILCTLFAVFRNTDRTLLCQFIDRGFQCVVIDSPAPWRS